MALAVETLKVNRTVGVEMEGYIDTNPHNASIPMVDKKEDGSLRNSYWDDEDEDDEEYDDDGCYCEYCRPSRDSYDDYGVELATECLTDLSDLYTIYAAMEKYGWHVDEQAGTHVHVDISDFSQEEKAKLLRFGKGIENIIYLFVQDSRYNNDYAEMLDEKWRKIFRKSGPYATVDWERVNTEVDARNTGRGARNYYGSLPNWLSRNGFPYPNTDKYQWMNVYSTNYPTVEFRIFNAIESADQVVTFALMAHNIVELVKNSTIKQLNFLIRRMYEVATPEEAAERFCQAINLGFVPPMLGQGAYRKLAEKLAGNVAEEELVEEAV